MRGIGVDGSTQGSGQAPATLRGPAWNVRSNAMPSSAEPTGAQRPETGQQPGEARFGLFPGNGHGAEVASAW